MENEVWNLKIDSIRDIFGHIFRNIWKKYLENLEKKLLKAQTVL